MKLYLSIFLLLPLIGCYLSYFENDSIDGYEVSFAVVVKYTIHVSIILFMALFISRKDSAKIDFKVDFKKTKNILKKVNVFLIFIFFIVLYFSAIPIFIQGSNRGIVRANLGIMGPIYTFLLQFGVALSVSIAGLLFFISENKKKIQKKVFFIFILSVIITLMTGYKSTVVTLMIPGVAFLLYNKSVIKFVPYSLFAVFLLIFTTMKVRDIPADLAWMFLKYRVFYLTNFGTLGVYYELGKGVSFDDFSLQMLSIFGDKIASLVSGIPANTPEFLKINLSKYISYLIYPDTSGVLEGKVNLTVANFGEAVYLFGVKFYFIFSILTGFLFGKIFKSINKSVESGNYKKAVLVGTYFFSIAIPWVNSSGFIRLFSIPNLTYMLLSYFILKLLTSKIKVA